MDSLFGSDFPRRLLVAIGAVREHGYAFMGEVFDTSDCDEWRMEICRAPFVPASRRGERGDVFTIGRTLAPSYPLSTAVGRELEAAVHECGGPDLADWQINDVTAQRTLPMYLAMAPRLMDQRYAKLVMEVTVCGRAPMRIHSDGSARSAIASCVTGPGTLVLLRGAGLGGEDGRRFYSVAAPPRGTRLSVSYRQDVSQ